MGTLKLSVNELSFSYLKDKPLLENISFSAEKGEIISILGPNGAGKTTLLKCLLGFLRPNCGDILIDNKNISSFSRRDISRKIAYVPQNRSINYSIDARNMILLGTAGRIGIFASPGKEEYQLVEQIASKLGISSLLDKKCAELSGGEYQLVLIARALVAKPEILILDEPESNLDFKNQIIVLDVLSSLKDEGICCIFNTHYPEHALQRADKSLLIYEGGYDFGKTDTIVNSDMIRKAFGVDTVIGEINENGKIYKTIFPTSISI